MRKIKHGKMAGGCSDACCLKLEGLNVRLEGEEILEDVSFHLHCGEIAALIGPNGAGKTTLVSEVARRIDPTVRVLVIPPEPTAEQCRDALSRLASLDSRSRGRVLAVGFLPLLFR
mgnify:CR=1 FL=1